MQRHIFNENEPTGAMSLMNLRNTLRGLFQGDLMPLRPRASMVLDDMEYLSSASAQAEWSGTGVTVGNSSIKQEGNYALECVIDGTGNRTVSNTENLDLSAFISVLVWERVDVVLSAFQFYLKDSSGNQSYWDIISNGTLDTWQQDTLTLASPDSNNGADAALSDIVEWGFRGLDASKTYLFDTVKAVCGLNVAVDYSNIGSFYKQIYVGNQPLEVNRQASPSLTPPSANPRIDILKINSVGTLAYIIGTEAASPTPDWSSLGNDFPICLVYCPTTMTKVVDYEDKDANPNEAYIYADVRPLLKLGVLTFLALTDTPSSFSGEALKVARVNSAETAIEFIQMLLGLLGDVEITSPTDGQQLEYEASTSKWKNKTPVAGDHGGLTGLGDDDHSQYHNASRHAAVSHSESMIASSAISQAKLKTAMGEVSKSGGHAYMTLPGGTYGFYPQTRPAASTTRAHIGIGTWGGMDVQYGTTTYTTFIFLDEWEGGGRTIYARQRYITSSGGDHWIFLLMAKVDYLHRNSYGGNIEIKKEQLLSSYQAPDHPCYGTGVDETEAPHPFRDYDPNKHQVVLVENEILPVLKTKVTSKRSLLSVINEDYEVDLDSAPVYKSREIIEIDEYGDKRGEVIKKIITPEWAKMMIDKDEIYLKRRLVAELPSDIKYKQLRLKG